VRLPAGPAADIAAFERAALPLLDAAF